MGPNGLAIDPEAPVPASTFTAGPEFTVTRRDKFLSEALFVTFCNLVPGFDRDRDVDGLLIRGGLWLSTGS